MNKLMTSKKELMYRSQWIECYMNYQNKFVKMK